MAWREGFYPLSMGLLPRSCQGSLGFAVMPISLSSYSEKNMFMEDKLPVLDPVTANGD